MEPIDVEICFNVYHLILAVFGSSIGTGNPTAQRIPPRRKKRPGRKFWYSSLPVFHSNEKRPIECPVTRGYHDSNSNNEKGPDMGDRSKNLYKNRYVRTKECGDQNTLNRP